MSKEQIKLELKYLANKFSSCALGFSCLIDSGAQFINYESLSLSQHALLLGFNVSLGFYSKKFNDKAEDFRFEAHPRPLIQPTLPSA